jgi:serine/threonine-protein kinase
MSEEERPVPDSDPPSQPAPERPPLEERIRRGDVLAGKYRVLKAIGAGGMGLVLLAEHVDIGQRVAIKVLRLDGDKDPRGSISRFKREARAIARIRSDHVIRVSDVAELDDGTPYMVMEYLEGRDLRQELGARVQLPIDEAVAYVLQACDGLADAHAAGVIHRDLKPGNLFLADLPSGKRVVKVLDFGISKLLPRPGEAPLTTTTSLMGSPLYMAPEQMRSSRDVDVRADVWSLGLILYELIAGEPAFGGDTIPEVCMNVMGADPTAISRYREGVPQELQAVLLRCLAKEREDRYPSMQALAKALEPFAAPRGDATVSRARAIERPAVPTLTEGGASRAPWGVPAPTPPEAPVSGKGKWVIAGVAAAAVAAIAGTLVARSSVPSRAPSPPVASAASAPSIAVPADVPPPSLEIASVDVNELPSAARDAGTARRAPVAAKSPPASRTPNATPAPTPTPSATSKDDWKWGDRN